MSKSDLLAWADLPPQGDSIEAHPTIVFAALAVKRWLERPTGWPPTAVQPSR
jgi:hypothetical protein